MVVRILPGCDSQYLSDEPLRPRLSSKCLVFNVPKEVIAVSEEEKKAERTRQESIIAILPNSSDKKLSHELIILFNE